MRIYTTLFALQAATVEKEKINNINQQITYNIRTTRLILESSIILTL